MNRDEYAQMYRLEDSHWWFVARRNLLVCTLRNRLSTLPESSVPLRLLDVGCGTGGTLDRLQSFGKVVGLDLEPLALEFCRARGWTTLVQASATAMPFADRAFDVVVALDVLEHIPDHAAAAREIARVLVPGGLLLTTVPAYPLLWSRHDVALMHQRRYVASEFGDLLTSAGLHVERLGYTVSALLPIVGVIRFCQRLFQPRAVPRADAAMPSPFLNRFLLRLLNIESALHGRSLFLPFGLTVFAMARRPL